MDEIQSALKNMKAYFEECVKNLEEAIDCEYPPHFQDYWINEIDTIKELLDEFETVMKGV